MRDYVQDEWPYLSLVPEQRYSQSSKPLGGVNSIIPIIVRVPREVDGSDGNPDEALAYDVSRYSNIDITFRNLTSCVPG